MSSCTGTQRNETLRNCVTTPCMDMKTIGIPPCTGTPGQPRVFSLRVSWIILDIIGRSFKVDLFWQLNSLSTRIPSRKNGNLFIPLVSGDEHRNIKNGICSYFPDKCCFSCSLSCFSPLTKSLTQVRRIPVQPFLHPTQIRLSPSSNWAVCKVSRDP